MGWGGHEHQAQHSPVPREWGRSIGTSIPIASSVGVARGQAELCVGCSAHPASCCAAAPERPTMAEGRGEQ